ncbi:chloride channel protein [Amycolatopsis sp. NPDC051903]|uniref:chloride channel protein n=1 Tax=Amycolatopsis sp. NPDC051903 TaxID=3363936 RepID=UPI0037BB8192
MTAERAAVGGLAVVWRVVVVVLRGLVVAWRPVSAAAPASGHGWIVMGRPVVLAERTDVREPTAVWWLVASAAPAGALAGAAAVAFGQTVGALRTLLSGAPTVVVVLAPVVGALVCVGLVRLVPDASGGGVSQVRQAFAVGAAVRGRVAGVKGVAAGVMLGSGGSGGAEGPVIHISAALGSALARLARLPSRPVAAAAVAGGVAASFGAPLTGVVLVAEVLVDGLAGVELAAVVVGAASGAAVGWALPGEPVRLPDAVVAGSPFGAAVAALFGVALAWFLWAATGRPGWVRAVVGGVAVGFVVLAVPDAAGVGLPGGAVLALAAAKIVATGLTVGAGGVVGTIGPALFVGATVGSALPMAGGAAAGMAACLAAASRAPATAVVLALELSGVDLLPPILLAAAVGWAASLLTCHGIFDVPRTKLIG